MQSPYLETKHNGENPFVKMLDTCLKNYPTSIVQYQDESQHYGDATIFHVVDDLCLEQQHCQLWHRSEEDVIDQGIPGFTHFNLGGISELYGMWPAHLSFQKTINIHPDVVSGLVKLSKLSKSAPLKKVLAKFEYLPENVREASKVLTDELAQLDVSIEAEELVKWLNVSSEKQLKELIAYHVGNHCLVIDTVGDFSNVLAKEYAFDPNLSHSMMISPFAWSSPLNSSKEWFKQLHNLVDMVEFAVQQNRAVIVIGTCQQYAPQLLLAVAMLRTYLVDPKLYKERISEDHRPVLALYEKLVHQRSPQFLQDRQSFAEGYALGMNLVTLADVRVCPVLQKQTTAYHDTVMPLLDKLSSSDTEHGDDIKECLETFDAQEKDKLEQSIYDYQHSLELTYALLDEQQREIYQQRQPSEKNIASLTLFNINSENLPVILEKIEAGYDVLSYENADGKTLLTAIIEAYLKPDSTLQAEDLYKFIVRARLNNPETQFFSGQEPEISIPGSKPKAKPRVPSQNPLQDFYQQFGDETLIRSAYKRCSMNVYKRISGHEREYLERMQQEIERVRLLPDHEQYQEMIDCLNVLAEELSTVKKSPIVRLIHKMQQVLVGQQDNRQSSSRHQHGGHYQNNQQQRPQNQQRRNKPRGQNQRRGQHQRYQPTRDRDDYRF